MSSKFTTPTGNPTDLIPKEIDVPMMGRMTRGELGHMIAGGVPVGGMGLAIPLDMMVSNVEEKDCHENLRHIFAEEIADLLNRNDARNDDGSNITAEDILGEQGDQLIEDHLFLLEEQAPGVYKKWTRDADITTKTTEFTADNLAQLGITAGMIATGIGTIPAIGMGMASGFVTNPIVSSALGNLQELSPDIPSQTIKMMAMKQLEESENPEQTSVQIDKPLVASLLVSAHPEFFKGENGPELAKEFADHIANPSEGSELATHAADLESAFTDYLVELNQQPGKSPEQAAAEVYKMIGDGTALDLIADNINSPEDLGSVSFNPKALMNKIRMNHMAHTAVTTKGPRSNEELAELATAEGKELLHGMQGIQAGPNTLASLPNKPQKGSRGGPQGSLPA